MKVSKASSGATMRRDWDERARKDAFHYVATWRKDWTRDTFLESGNEEYVKLVEPVLEEFGLVPDGASMLEVGCGAGRMTGSFARRFATVNALDISTKMQDLAKENLAEFRNIQWVIGDGTTLSAVPSDSVDFAFSYLVLQHLPTEDLVLTYIREMVRVLKPGGLFLFQFNGTKRPTMNWKGRLAWSAVDFLWVFNLRGASHALARLLGFDPETAGKSWRGASLRAGKVVETLRGVGGIAVQVAGDQTPMVWCRGKKAAKVAPDASV
jgi:ubiquinone/menaquinone biosynthesis C-methylase UbiE